MYISNIIFLSYTWKYSTQVSGQLQYYILKWKNSPLIMSKETYKIKFFLTKDIKSSNTCALLLIYFIFIQNTICVCTWNISYAPWEQHRFCLFVFDIYFCYISDIIGMFLTSAHKCITFPITCITKYILVRKWEKYYNIFTL